MYVIVELSFIIFILLMILTFKTAVLKILFILKSRWDLKI